jgi:hypothetical protein
MRVFRRQRLSGTRSGLLQLRRREDLLAEYGYVVYLQALHCRLQVRDASFGAPYNNTNKSASSRPWAICSHIHIRRRYTQIVVKI